MSGPVKPRGDEISDETNLLASAKSGDRHVFQQLTEHHRRELQLPRDRMTASLHSAE